MTRRWEVDVRVDGELVLTIGQNLSGVENIEDFADEVREAGEHLLSFIGPDRSGLLTVGSHWQPEGRGADTIMPGDTVECIDGWDSFNNLTVGKLYDVLDTKDGMIFVRGNHGHVGGWQPFHFKHVEAASR